jgi:hypothetical protein
MLYMTILQHSVADPDPNPDLFGLIRTFGTGTGFSTGSEATKIDIFLPIFVLIILMNT